MLFLYIKTTFTYPKLGESFTSFIYNYFDFKNRSSLNLKNNTLYLNEFKLNNLNKTIRSNPIARNVSSFNTEQQEKVIKQFQDKVDNYNRINN